MLQRFGKLAAVLAMGMGLIAAAPAVAQVTPAQDFADMSRRLMPAVVNISTRQRVSTTGLPSFPPGSRLQEFNDLMGRGEDDPRRQGSLGSGFVIDASGYVVTNNHVIEGADEIDVIMSDGRTFPAKLIGRDEVVDLALLKVESKTPLPVVPWGDSDAAQVGSWVVAIGNPFGLGGTVTVGIVSARNRNINSSDFDDFIQTDAAINHGNSGGPLFNMKGEVIGINTAIISGGEGGGSVGVGFSVPSNLAKSITGQLRQFGSTHRGFFGVSVKEIDQRTAESFGLQRPEGAIITAVQPNGPGALAQLKVGDLITAFNNQPVRNDRDVSRILGGAQVGAQIPVKFMRGGKVMQVTVRLAGTPGGPRQEAKPDDTVTARKLSNVIGVTFRPMNDQDRLKSGVPRNFSGLVVQQVESGSDASGRLRPGDIVLEVNFQPATSAEQAIRAAEAAKAQGKPVLLQVWGRGEARFVSVRTR